MWILFIDFFQWNELVEDTIIDHQQHRRVRKVILRTKVSFGSIVSLYIMHLWRVNDLFVLFAVRSESHPTVEEYLQIRPYFFQCLLTGFLENTLDKYQHPRRHAGQTGHIDRDGTVGYRFYFSLPFAHQSDFLARYADEIDQRIDILNQNG